jgi:hypothetical protein
MFWVVWLESALMDLADYWPKADSALRLAITSATHEIDQQLKKDPIGASESRTDDTRILFVAPLGITFQLEADGQTGLDVWVFHKRAK